MAIVDNKFKFKFREGNLNGKPLVHGDVILKVRVKISGIGTERIVSRWGELECLDGVAEIQILEPDLSLVRGMKWEVLDILTRRKFLDERATNDYDGRMVLRIGDSIEVTVVGEKGDTEISGSVIEFGEEFGKSLGKAFGTDRSHDKIDEYVVIRTGVAAPNRPKLLLYFDRYGVCFHVEFDRYGHDLVRTPTPYRIPAWKEARLVSSVDFGKDEGTVVSVVTVTDEK